jgi:hypothetical protein
MKQMKEIEKNSSGKSERYRQIVKSSLSRLRIHESLWPNYVVQAI